MKRSMAVLMCLSLVLTLTSPGEIQAKKKKPALSKKKVEITVGKKATIKVKRGKKKAKVTFKTSKKSIVKIIKKTKQGNKARVTIKGVRKGKAKITAVYKLGKKKTKLTCKVTVKAGKDNQKKPDPQKRPSGEPSGNSSAAPSAAPSKAPTLKPSEEPSTAPSEEPSTAPSEEPSTAPSLKPSDSPTEKPTTAPTEVPVAENHEKVTISEANVAFADTEKAEYHNGMVDLKLTAKDSGHGICFYLNDEHASVDMGKYTSLKIKYETKSGCEMAVNLKNNIPASAASDYWAGADSGKCPLVGKEQYPTFAQGEGEYKMSLSDVKSEKAQAVFIKYNSHNLGDDAPSAELTIKSIQLEKNLSYVPPTPEPTATPTPVVTGDKEIALTAESLAYNKSTSAGEVTFEDGKMKYTTTGAGRDVGLAYFGLYINSDKSAVPWSAYKAIKINASSADGEPVKLTVGFLAGEITKTEGSTFGGAEQICSGKVTGESGSDIIVRPDLLQISGTAAKNIQNLWDSSVLYINNDSSSVAVDYTINSITLLKECPNAEEDLNIDITEENLAFSTVKAGVTIKDGHLEADMESGEQIGFYLKDDKSLVDLSGYHSLDIMGTTSATLINFAKAENVDPAKVCGGGTKLLTDYRGSSGSLYYFDTNLIKDDLKITGTKQGNIVYLQCNMVGGKKIELNGIRLRKNAYANIGS